MKKKIFIGSILAALLMASMPFVSAETINEVNMETYSKLPDLKVSLSSPKRGVFVVTLQNDADVPAVLPDFYGYCIFTLVVHKVYNSSGSEKERFANIFYLPASEYGKDAICAHYYDCFEFNLPLAYGENFILRGRVRVDDLYLIPESNESNNYDELDILPKKSNTYNGAFNMPLLNVFEKLN